MVGGGFLIRLRFFQIRAQPGSFRFRPAGDQSHRHLLSIAIDHDGDRSSGLSIQIGVQLSMRRGGMTVDGEDTVVRL